MKKSTNIKKADYTTVENKARKGFKLYATIVLTILMVVSLAITSFAAKDAMSQVNSLKDFLFNLMTTIGAVLIGFGVVQLGLSLKSHDPSQRGNAILTVAGGIVIACIKPIVTLITG